MRRPDLSRSERQAVLTAYEHGGDPVAILRSRLDASIAIRLALAKRMRVLLVIALAALALALVGYVELRKVVNNNRGLIRSNCISVENVKSELRDILGGFRLAAPPNSPNAAAFAHAEAVLVERQCR